MKIRSIGARLLLLALLAACPIFAVPSEKGDRVCQLSSTLLQDSPRKSQLQLGLKSSETQLTGDWYPPEEDKWRWMGQSAGVHLGLPGDEQATLELEFILPPELLSAVGTVAITLSLDEQFLDELKYVEPGVYTYRGLLSGTQFKNPVTCLQISVGQTFRPPRDKRDLGVAVVRAGLISPESVASATE